MQRRSASDRGRAQRRRTRLNLMMLEALEERVVMSTGVSGALYAVPGAVPKVVSTVGPNALYAVPGVVPMMVPGAGGDLVPFASSGPLGYTPQQLQAAYGLNQISFAGIKGDGAGQTITIVDAYDNPSFVNSTDPNFATSALHMFDLAYGLPDPPSFTKVNQNGASSPLAPSSAIGDWSIEIAIDVEWAHAMAPAANIILVEAADSYSSIRVAEVTASHLGTIVSMSYGSTEYSGEINEDPHFNVPGVTFLASTGDDGVPGGYSAYSPYVVAVGGTSLQGLNAAGDYPGIGTNGEVGWSGSGGGYSKYEPQPSYQKSVQHSGFRSVPDISADADPNTGVGIYDPYDTGVSTPWSQWGGTSLSAPLMAGMFAIVNQGRLLNGGGAFSSTEALTALYDLAGKKPGDFHDILLGNNGYDAGAGYDLVTGLGTPNGSQLVRDLAGYGLIGLQSIAVTPVASSLGDGLSEQYTATGTFAGGETLNITCFVAWASSNTSVATINSFGIASALSPGTTQITASLRGVTSNGATLTVLPVISIAVAPADAYVPVLLSQQYTATGTFSDGSTGDLTRVATWTSSNTATATIDASGLATAKALGTSIITASLDGVSSPDALLTAVAPSFVIDTTADDVDYTNHKTSLREAILAANVYSGMVVTFDQIVFASAQTIHLSLGSLDLMNQGGTESIIAPTAGLTVDADGLSRVFSIAPFVTASVTGLTITGGLVADGVGGGVYNAGGDLRLTDCVISGNSAAAGGGIYAILGTTNLTGTTVSGNNAGVGGGILGVLSDLTLTNSTVSGNSAGYIGGGLYIYHGKTELTGTTVSGNSASFSGGGILAVQTDLTLTDCTISGDSASQGGGLYLFSGKTELTGTTVSGNSASYFGGGLLDVQTDLTLTDCTISGNYAGFSGGGLLNAGTLTMTDSTISENAAGYNGGGAANYDMLTLTRCAISGNSAGYNGGGVYNGDLSVTTVRQSTIMYNTADAGGGIANSGTLSVDTCAISYNQATSRGGGISTTAGRVDIVDSLITGNLVESLSTALGGGIASEDSILSMARCIVALNQANGKIAHGGGIYALDSTVRLYRSYVTGNTANGSQISDGGGIYSLGGTLDLWSTFVFGNKAKNGTADVFRQA